METDENLVGRKRSSRVVRVLAIALGAAVGLGAIVGAGFLGFANPSVDALIPAVVEAEETAVQVTGRLNPQTPQASVRFPTCSISSLLDDPRMDVFSGVVMDPWSGEVLFARASEDLLAPASVLKTVTAAAALSALGPDATFATTVRAGETSQSVVLVGGGDPTLRSRSGESESVYVQAPSLTELAEQTIAAVSAGLEEGTKVSITELIVDATLWDSGDNWDDSWAESARVKGFLSRVTALQVDGDRSNPAAAMSPRGNDPVTRAANTFVDALKAAGNTARSVTIRYENPDSEGAVLARVESRPVQELVTYMLKESDNTLAEFLARHASLAEGLDGSQSSVGEALHQALEQYGVSAEGITIRDGSGLSAMNQVTPEYIAGILMEVFRSEGSIGFLAEALPIAGVDGSLDDRFGGENAVVTSRVQAKTGSISGTRSLAGFIKGVDDSDRVFAFFATGAVDDDARTALETVVAGVYSCGANLADF
ncbi:D-alanyl-D-alanine carboxypeptidase/D-alanyl-D-alanine-endopeptidase [Pontimonas sp.]|nr:D-alanyl-D-alanine carboxypeptidase/D-alanyl-D-alanine-endopeptidase [Pontimonas sp.]MDA8909512.1 D-alanyl-D-alanine carboxypeptidase/D-alanyl-D-alanine-endopeptidase [Pontimonas sp.]